MVVCPRTGEPAPPVVTMHVSKENPTTAAWIVTPECLVKDVSIDVFGALELQAEGIERIESVPTKTISISSRGNPLSKGFNGMKSLLSSISVSEFDASFAVNTDLPDSLQSLDLRSSSMTSLSKLRIPPKLRALSLSEQKITSLKNIAFPESLTMIWLVNNKLTSFESTLPSKVQTFFIDGNNFPTLERLTLPMSLQFFGCNSCGTSVVRGIRWPTSLTALSLKENLISTFEIRESDIPIFSRVSTSLLFFTRSVCTEGVLTDFPNMGVKLCVISDARFEALYGSEGGGAENTQGPSVAPGIPSPPVVNSTIATQPPTPESLDSGSGSSSVSGQWGLLRPTSSQPSPQPSFQSSPTSQASSSPSPSPSSLNDMSNPIESTVPRSSTTTMAIVVAIIAGALVAIFVAVIVYRNAAAKNRRKALYQGVASKENTESSATTNQTSGNADSQEFLANDVRNSKSLLRFRVDLGLVHIKERVASGGFGVIHRAKFQGRDVAVKQMLPGGWQVASVLGGFMDEIHLCAALNHPKIVSFVGISWNSLRDLSVIIEFMPGGDLHGLLHRQQEPPSPDHWKAPWTANKIKSKTSIAQDVTEAVVYLHSFQTPIIHRDLKARNVLLDTEGNAKLSDFGISRELSLDETMTSEIGTAAWIAPEVLRGERYSEKADIYSLGVLLVELDRCSHPYADERALQRGVGASANSDAAARNIQIAMQVSTGQLRPQVSSGCPDEVGVLVSKCLRLDATERPAAVEVLYALQILQKPSVASA